MSQNACIYLINYLCGLFNLEVAAFMIDLNAWFWTTTANLNPGIMLINDKIAYKNISLDWILDKILETQDTKNELYMS